MRSGHVARTVVVLLALSLAAGPVAAGVAAGDPTIRAHHVATGQPEPGVVSFRTTYALPETTSRLVVTPDADDRITVTGASGFENGSDGWLWTRADANTAEPTIRWRASINETDALFGGYDAVGTGEWALFERPSLPYHYWYDGAEPTTASTTAVASNASGYTSDWVVYLGDYRATETRRGDQNYTVVVPASATDPPEPSAVVETFAFARRILQVGAVDRYVTAFVGPEPLRGGGVKFNGGDTDDPATPDPMWVHADSQANGPTYYSEYVHTRQDFNETDRMAWITEAQDGYYSVLLVLYRGDTTYEAFHETVTTEANESAVLAPANRTASRRAADYTKGARVLAALDGKIRRATDRRGSLEDVWRLMNAHDGPLSYTDFTGIVADVAGESFDDWLARHLTTSAVPTVPDNRTLYAPVDDGADPDGDGTDTKAELANGTTLFATPEAPSDTAEDDSEDADEDDTGPVTTIVVLASLGIVAVSGAGFGVVAAARLLNRSVDWVPEIVVRRSLWRLLAVTVAGVVTLFGYVILFA